MRNTLTWDIKSIQVPKVNSNLLSVASLILLLTMAFLTFSVIADHCGELKKKLDAAGKELKDALWAHLAAEVALYISILLGTPGAVARAKKALDEAADRVEEARRRYTSILVAYQACLEEHNQSGGCDS